MRSISIFLTLCFFNPTFNSYSQRVLSGVVTSYGIEVPNITVFQLGGDKDLTDSNGQFKIDLAACEYCNIGDQISLYVTNEEYGFHNVLYTISNNLTTKISIERNPNSFGIIGTVRDRSSREFLKDIDVQLASIPLSSKIPKVKTNDFGNFVIYLRKDLIGHDKYIELSFKDGKGKYLDKVETKNLLSPFEIFMEKGGVIVHKKISGYERVTELFVKPNDEVKVKATGSIRVGPIVGHSGPQGRTGGFANSDLSQYNIVRDFNHAALMYRFSGETEWHFAGSELDIISQKEGYLEFEVNDNQKGNNSGAYDIKIMLK